MVKFVVFLLGILSFAVLITAQEQNSGPKEVITHNVFHDYDHLGSNQSPNNGLNINMSRLVLCLIILSVFIVTPICICIVYCIVCCWTNKRSNKIAEVTQVVVKNPPPPPGMLCRVPVQPGIVAANH